MMEAKEREARKYNQMGIESKKNSDDEKAIEHFSMALALDPDYLHAMNNLGYMLMDIAPTRAKKLFERSLSLNPHNAHTLNNIGYLHYKNREYRKAETLYQKALSIDENFVCTYWNLYELYTLQQRYKDAELLCKKLIKLQPTLYKTYVKLANAYRKQYYWDNALASCQRGLKHTKTTKEKETLYALMLNIRHDQIESIQQQGTPYYSFSELEDIFAALPSNKQPLFYSESSLNEETTIH